MSPQRYVLITPARNEEAFIEKTLQSVVAQPHLPEKWVVVSDGSTDRTDEIVRRYEGQHSFIQLVRAKSMGKPNFGSKVAAFKAGYEQLGDIDYDYIGNLDGDVSFSADYFERMLSEFDKDPKLGLVGGIILEKINDCFVAQKISLNSVAGAVQLFRRECYESFGGYVPLKVGGIDSAAEIMARMKGWTVRTIPEMEVKHHGRIITGKKNIFSTRFHKGVINYLLGYHPLFHLVLSVYRAFDRPYLLGGLMIYSGYVWAWLRRYESPMPREIVRLLRQEQKQRLRMMLSKGTINP